MRHTRWLILLTHPSLVGCGATTPISMHLLYRVCYCHPQICQGAPNNLSPIYCQMVFNFIVYLYKRPKLLTTGQIVWPSKDLTRQNLCLTWHCPLTGRYLQLLAPRLKFVQEWTKIKFWESDPHLQVFAEFVPFFRNKFPGLFQDSDWFFKGSKIHFNPYTPKISVLILLTAFNTFLIF